MPEPNDICYHALLEVTHRRGSRFAALSPGAYVHAWTFAGAEDQARADIVREATDRFEAETVAFDEFAPGDPRDIGVPPAELRSLFEESPVVFGTSIGWGRRRWWQFWR